MLKELLKRIAVLTFMQELSSFIKASLSLSRVILLYIVVYIYSYETSLFN